MRQSQRSHAHRRATRRRLARWLLFGSALGLTIAFGMTTPEPAQLLLTRFQVVGFSLTFIVTLAAVVAVIPSPADPRERARDLFFIRGWNSQKPKDAGEDPLESEYPDGVPSDVEYESARRGRDET